MVATVLAAVFAVAAAAATLDEAPIMSIDFSAAAARVPAGAAPAGWTAECLSAVEITGGYVCVCCGALYAGVIVCACAFVHVRRCACNATACVQ